MPMPWIFISSLNSINRTIFLNLNPPLKPTPWKSSFDHYLQTALSCRATNDPLLMSFVFYCFRDFTPWAESIKRIKQQNTRSWYDKQKQAVWLAFRTGWLYIWSPKNKGNRNLFRVDGVGINSRIIISN